MAPMKYELTKGVLSRVGANEPIFAFTADDPISIRIVQLYSAMLAVSLEALGEGDEFKRREIQDKMISCDAVAAAMKKYDPSKDTGPPAVETLRVLDLLNGEFDVTFEPKE